MKVTPIKHLVFDMGGVLLNIHWHQQVSRILGKEIPFDQVHQLWADSKATHAFEIGELDFEQFTTLFIEEFKLELSRDDFQEQFRAIVAEDFPGSVPLLKHLRLHYQLSLLSNTNPCHWAMAKQRESFLPLIHNPFTSLDFGVMKPDPAIYQKLLEALDASPETVLFFDDGLKNVEAAKAMGIEAERVFNPEDIKAALVTRGMWPE